MINETNILKTVNAKQYTKSKYLISSFLKTLYNSLNANDHFGASKRFTIVSEAIFFMLSETKPQSIWVDYSELLETAYKQGRDFPDFLKSNFNQIKQYCYTCPVVAQHSNELILIGIVEKLLIKCVDDKTDQDLGMDMDSGGEERNKTEAILQLIGQPMVNYRVLDRVPSADIVEGPFFMQNLARFVNQLNVDTEVVKRIVKIIPLEYKDISESLRNIESVLLEVIQNYNINSFKEFCEVVNNVLKELQVPGFENLLETVKKLLGHVKKLEIDYSTLERDLESKPDLECTVGDVAVQQFQKFKIPYIMESNVLNTYDFYFNALQTFARCYVMSLNEKFYSSEQEKDQCTADQNYFLSKLNAYIEFFYHKTTLTELIEFKNQILFYAGTQGTVECIQTLKLIVEIHKVPTLDLVYSETKILFELIGISGGTTNVVQFIQSFLNEHGGNTLNFSETMIAVKKTLTLISTNKSATHCASVVQSLITVCGGGGENLEKVLENVQKIKTVYNKRIPDENFSIDRVGLDMEKFISRNDTGLYTYIPGETNNQKLEYVHEKLTEPLKEIIAPSVTYSELVIFLNRLLDEIKPTKLDKTILDTVVRRNTEFETLEDNKKTLVKNLKSQSEQLENCTKNLEDLKIKYEVSVKSNNDYADKIKALEQVCSDQTKLKLDYDMTVQQLNELKKEHSILVNTHKLVQLEVDEFRAKQRRKIAAVKPKKRKLSDPSEERHGDEKR